MYHTALNTNTILHVGKDIPTISVLKPNKAKHWHKLAIHITFITHCQSTRESAIIIQKTLRLFLINMDSNINTQDILHNIFHQITKCFKNPRQHHTVAVAWDMSKAFDTVNKNKIILANITNIIKFIANYI